MMGQKTFSVFLMLVLVVTAFTFKGVSVVKACSCIQPGTPTESLQSVDEVFRGYVKSITYQAVDETTSRGFLVEFEASEVWKGKLAAKKEIKTAQDSASCGFDFEEGREYIVYAYKDEEGELVTNLCMRTSLTQNAQEDLEELGQGDFVATLYDDNDEDDHESEVTSNDNSNTGEDSEDSEEKLAKNEVILGLFALTGLSILISLVSIGISLISKKRV